MGAGSGALPFLEREERQINPKRTNKMKHVTYASLAGDACASKSNIYNLHELVEMKFPEPQPLVKELLFADETALFIARQKEGKSTLMLQFCLDVARAKQFLGRYQSLQTDVFYVDYENRPYHLQKRVRNLLKGDEAPNNFYYYALENLIERDLSLGIEENFNRLELKIDELKPGLLVIDPLRYAADGEIDEKGALRIVERVAKLKSINSAMAVILVHHLRKSTGESGQTLLKVDPRTWIDNVYGSQALLAHVESIWGMQGDDDGYTFATVARSHRGQNIRLSKNPDSQEFVFDAETRRDFTAAELEAWNKLGQSFTWTEAQGLGIPNSTLGRTIRKASENGLLRQDPDTKRHHKLPEEVGVREDKPDMIM
jgi:hypothetical protein